MVSDSTLIHTSLASSIIPYTYVFIHIHMDIHARKYLYIFIVSTVLFSMFLFLHHAPSIYISFSSHILYIRVFFPISPLPFLSLLSLTSHLFSSDTSFCCPVQHVITPFLSIHSSHLYTLIFPSIPYLP